MIGTLEERRKQNTYLFKKKKKKTQKWKKDANLWNLTNTNKARSLFIEKLRIDKKEWQSKQLGVKYENKNQNKKPKKVKSSLNHF